MTRLMCGLFGLSLSLAAFALSGCVTALSADCQRTLEGKLVCGGEVVAL